MRKFDIKITKSLPPSYWPEEVGAIVRIYRMLLIFVLMQFSNGLTDAQHLDYAPFLDSVEVSVVRY